MDKEKIKAMAEAFVEYGALT